LIVVKPDTKSLRNFKFKNTRLNHVEPYFGLMSMDKAIEIPKAELLQMVEQLKEDNVYFEYTKNKTGVASVSTLSHVYKPECKYSEVVNEFEKTSGLCNIKICDIHDSNISGFVKSAVRYNETIDFQSTQLYRNNLGALFHIDMKKAYSSYAKNKYYEEFGFLGKITDFRKCSNQHGTGLYQIEKLNFWRCSKTFRQYNDMMRCYEAEGGIFTSPELQFLNDMKVDYTIVAGCWGVAPLKFDIPAEMLQKDSDGVSFYARHAGACNRITTRQKIYVQNSDATWLGTIAAIPGVRIESFEFGESCISTLKKSCNHLSH
jgi:hypothetical protein